jgi:hypothetical protein
MFAATKALYFSDDQHEGQCRERTNTGMRDLLELMDRLNPTITDLTQAIEQEV